MTWRGKWPPSAAETPCPRRRAKGDRTPSMVSCPLLTPLTFLWTRLPSVARLNARGPQGRLVLQGYTLDRSGAFRSANQAPCTVWPRTVMRGGLRKVNSGSDSVPKAARRTEPSPCSPVSPRDRRESQRKGGFGGVKRGQGNHTVPLPPFVSAARRRLSRPPKAATVHAMSWRISPSPGGPISPAAAGRRNGGTAHPLLRVKTMARRCIGGRFHNCKSYNYTKSIENDRLRAGDGRLVFYDRRFLKSS